ncbi:MAG: TIGR02147 family protein [Oligoflexus sp.]
MTDSKKLKSSHKVNGLLQKEADSHRIFDFVQYTDYLAAIYAELKNQLSSYSYLQFAEDLGFPRSNALWLIISGRRKLSPKAAERILKSIPLKSMQRRYFLAMVRHNNANQGREREKFLQDLIEIKAQVIPDHEDRERLEYFSEWYYPVIREMVGTTWFQSDPQWIAEQLFMKIMPKQAGYALDLLERLNLISWDVSKGRHVLTGGQVHPTREVGPIAAIRYHEKMCEIARDSVTRVPSSLRDLNALTVRLKPEDAARVKARLIELCHEVFAMEAASQGSEDENVYQVNMQLFPLVVPKK